MKLQLIIMLSSSLLLWSCSGDSNETKNNNSRQTDPEVSNEIKDKSLSSVEDDEDLKKRIKATFLNYVYQNHIPFTDGMKITKENLVISKQNNDWKVDYHIDLHRTTQVDGETFELNDNLDIEAIISLRDAINDIQYTKVSGKYEMNNQYVYSFYGPQDNITGGDFEDDLNVNLSGEIKTPTPPIKSSLYQIGTRRLFEEKELRALTLEDLRFLRNEFYARKGYIFKTDKIKNYFTEKEWYQGSVEDPSTLLDVTEKENVFLIKTIEEEKRLVSNNVSNDNLYNKGINELLSEEELSTLSSSRLYFLRNEFYARKGYIFKKETLAAFFGNFEWYTPSNKEVDLSDVEIKNISLIHKLEKEKKAKNL